MLTEAGRRFSLDTYTCSVKSGRSFSTGFIRRTSVDQSRRNVIYQSFRKDTSDRGQRSFASDRNSNSSIGESVTIKRRRSNVRNRYLVKEENAKRQAEPEVDPQEVFRGFAYEKIKTVFDLTTINGEININVDNVFPLMKTLELDPKDETVLDMVRTACIETFGDMDPIEFDSAVIEQRRQKAEDPEDFENEIRSAFYLIDADQDGMISLPDVYQLMMGLGEMLTDEELAEMIQAADTDKDGQLSYKEFKRFLVGLTEEEENEDIEIEQQEEDDQHPEDAEKEASNKENEQTQPEIVPEVTSGVEQTDEAKSDEKQKDESKEDEAKEPVKKSLEKRKSVLWAYTSREKPKVEEPKIQADDSVEKSKDTENQTETNLKSEEKKSEETDKIISTENDEETSSIIAVTVKHLDSSKEAGNSNNSSSVPQQRKVYRPGSSRTIRTRPNSSVTVSESIVEDSGIGMTDSEQFNNDLDNTEDEGMTPRRTRDRTRTPSVGSRITSARSRLSSARSRDVETIQTESTSIELNDDLSDLEDDDEKSDITDPDVFHSPPSARQKSQLEKLNESHTYCEITNPNSEGSYYSGYSSRSSSPRLSYKNLEEYLPQKFSSLKRIKSSNALRRINDIEQTLLKRQTTAPQLNMDAIRQANSSVVKVKTKPNVNGICTHLSIDLNIPLLQSNKLTNYKSYMQRPKTALSFMEAQRKSLVRTSSFTSGRLVHQSDGNANIIDLSKTLASKDTGYTEHPTLSFYHHGYKSVRPLARVMSAFNKSKQNGRTVEFNSLSRQLEKGFIVKTEKSRKHSKLTSPAPSSRQSVITLEMPVQSNEPKCKRFSHLRRLPSGVHAWN